MTDQTQPWTVESLFDAEARLRAAARDYAAATGQSIGVRFRAARELRAAARRYSELADAIDAAMASAAELVAE